MTIEKTIQKFDIIINQNIDFSSFCALDLSSKGEEEALLRTYREESKIILNLISKDLENLKHGQRILEIGAGTGLVSHVLKNSGFEIDAIEPSSLAFGFMRELSFQLKSILESEGLLTCNIQDTILENYNSKKKYDLIFSSHVLEHVADIPTCFKKIAELSDVNAKSIHLCPNYIVPFEPHLGHWIVPFAREFNYSIFRKSYKQKKSIWDNINFITSSEVKRVAKTNGFKVNFDRSILQFYLNRYNGNSELRNRHDSKLMSFVVSLLLQCKIYKFVPAELQSPMLFTLTKDRPLQ